MKPLKASHSLEIGQIWPNCFDFEGLCLRTSAPASELVSLIAKKQNMDLLFERPQIKAGAFIMSRS